MQLASMVNFSTLPPCSGWHPNSKGACGVDGDACSTAP